MQEIETGFSIETKLGPYLAFKSKRNNNTYALCLAVVSTTELSKRIRCPRSEALARIGYAGQQGLVVESKKREDNVLVSPDTEILLHPAFRLPLESYRTIYLARNNKPNDEASAQLDNKQNSNLERTRKPFVFHSDLIVKNIVLDSNVDYIANKYPNKFLEEERLKYFLPYIREQAAAHKAPKCYEKTFFIAGKQAALMSLRGEMSTYKWGLDEHVEKIIKQNINDVIVASAYLFYYTARKI